jgi:hypothetical protein
MKTQILSVVSGVALALSLSAVQATESVQASEVQATGEADVAAQVETLPQEMLAILGDVNQEEIFLMEDQEMDTSVGTARASFRVSRYNSKSSRCYRHGKR